MPLVRAKIQVKEHCHARGPGTFYGENGCASAGFAAKVRASKFESPALLKRRSQHIVYCQLHVSGVISVKDQRKPIRRFNPQNHCTTASARLTRNEVRLYPSL